MDRFEYLSVLVSIVIALGMSEVVSGWGRLLRQRADVRFSLLHASWSLFSLALMAQFWWGFWNYRVIEDWTFGALLLVLAIPFSIVLAAQVITPSEGVVRGLDLREYFLGNRRLFFGTAASLLLLLGLADGAVAKQPVLHVENAIRLAGLAIVALAAKSANLQLHLAIVALAFVLLTAFVAWEFWA